MIIGKNGQKMRVPSFLQRGVTKFVLLLYDILGRNAIELHQINRLYAN
jgi:hypothetical protein